MSYLQILMKSRKVRKKMYKSSWNERCLMYHRSSLILRAMSSTSGVSPRYPSTCASPVIPGFTASLCMYSGISDEYICVWYSMCGRGPMSDMSPFNTLINWGSSSKDVLLRKWPMLVTRRSLSVACRMSASLFILIVRNFRQVNTCPSFPCLCCLNKTGPCDVNLTAIPIIIYRGRNKVQMNTNETAMSKIRFSISALSKSLWEGRESVWQLPPVLFLQFLLDLRTHRCYALP